MPYNTTRYRLIYISKTLINLLLKPKTTNLYLFVTAFSQKVKTNGAERERETNKSVTTCVYLRSCVSVFESLFINSTPTLRMCIVLINIKFYLILFIHKTPNVVVIVPFYCCSLCQIHLIRCCFYSTLSILFYC